MHNTLASWSVLYSIVNSDYVETSYLSVFVQDVAKEAEGVREALRACTLPHTHNTMLLRMEHPALAQAAVNG